MQKPPGKAGTMSLPGRRSDGDARRVDEKNSAPVRGRNDSADWRHGARQHFRVPVHTAGDRKKYCRLAGGEIASQHRQ